MTELPRYDISPSFGVVKAKRGIWMKWADVSSRLQQLEQEKATLLERLARFSECASMACPYETRMRTAEAALAETRAALHQITEKYEKLVARVEQTGVIREDSVPQGRTE